MTHRDKGKRQYENLKKNLGTPQQPWYLSDGKEFHS